RLAPFSGRELPEADMAVLASTGQPLPVRGEIHCFHPTAVRAKGRPFSIGRTHQMNGLICAGRRDHLSLRGEGEGSDAAYLCLPEQLPGSQTPALEAAESTCSIRTLRDQGPSIRTEGYVPDTAATSRKGANLPVVPALE